ncbi:chromosomal replication initiator DnaA [Xanthobacter dioxanivorans]|uniref:Chromosomal replication initiator DnaA n=1 Tax=Xanthobacter dioxanivorans TaxID=2528964 RepID=A0A974PQ35_9HYPH|nr:helix-turn-helix domain-containing protein [Xanthobacter dioxanivorans]QRG07620.1 chromosomal replication initiator DnaA [Xanthobacter dioxanivorans]
MHHLVSSPSVGASADADGPCGADLATGSRTSYRVITALVAAATGVSVEVLLARHRCTAPVAAARQLAMYLAHVALGLTQTEVALAFGRDRTTVAHACRRIEDLRDQAAFDRKVARMEECLRWVMER